MSSEAYNSMPVPTNLSILKNHEMWFYFFIFYFFKSPMSVFRSFPLLSTISVFPFFLLVTWPSTFHMRMTPKFGHAIKRFSKEINFFKF